MTEIAPATITTTAPEGKALKAEAPAAEAPAADAPAMEAPAAAAPAATAPAAEAPAVAAPDAATNRSSSKSQPQQQRPKHLQQGARTPPTPPASPEDGPNIQTLAATAPGPQNAVKGSQRGTRMVKPRFKAVRATIEVDPAPAATATDAPITTPRHNKPTKTKPPRRRRQTPCFDTY